MAEGQYMTETLAFNVASTVQHKLSISIDWNLLGQFLIDLLEVAVTCAPFLMLSGETPKQYIDDHFTDDGEPDQMLVDRYRTRAFHLNRKGKIGFSDDDLTVLSVGTLNGIHNSDDAMLNKIVEENTP